ncbi:MAG: hypothetical protein J0I12_17930 [Candidatus Eremiobacteraeota bacterium]|nr:hypothetical protein [Candidatus Eremiobacteraeota bacterium]
MTRYRRGVSLLLETIVTLGLFAAALLVTMGIITGVSQSSSQSREYTLARDTARQAMEQQRVLPYASIGSPATPPYLVVVPFTNNGQTSSVDFTVTIQVSEPAPGKYKDIVVTVAWKHGDLTRQIQLETSASNV